MQQPDEKYSLCIPRVSSDVTYKDIYNTFNKLNIGQIQRVDIINGKGNNNFKRAFIHFKNLFNNENALFVKSRLDNGKDIKIVYNDPWYWKASLYRSSKTI